MPEPLPTILLEETLPISPRELWRLVMGNPDFLKSVSKLKKNRDLKVGQWRLSKGTQGCMRTWPPSYVPICSA